MRHLPPSEAPLHSLDLVGDGDDAEIIVAVEQAFQVDFGEESQEWETMGDLFRALAARFPAAEGAGKCASAMAFYQLRRLLDAEMPHKRRLRPETRFQDLNLPPPKELVQNLKSRAPGLTIPSFSLSWAGAIGSWMMIAALAGLLIGLMAPAFLWLLPLFPLGIGLIWLDRGSYGDRTLGALAQDLVTPNFAYFAARGADHRSDRVWHTLCGIASETACVDAARITPETRFFPQPQAQRSA